MKIKEYTENIINYLRNWKHIISSSLVNVRSLRRVGEFLEATDFNWKGTGSVLC